MKKTLVALAVSAASLASVAQADNTTLYGEVKSVYTIESVNQHSGNTINNVRNTIEDSKSGLSAKGKLGVKGSNDLGDGLSAFYKLEMEAKKSDTVKPKKGYVGLKGEFGKVTLGHGVTVLADDLGNYSDPFNSLTPDTTVDAVAKIDKNYAVVYDTPNMDGFSAAVNVNARKGQDNDHVDSYSVAAKYDANGVFVGAGYFAENHSDKEVLNVGLGYGDDAFEVGAHFSRSEDGANKVNQLRVAGLYNVDAENSVYAGFGTAIDSNVDDKSAAAVGFNHKFSKRTNAWAEYKYQEAGDSSTVALGLKTKF